MPELDDLPDSYSVTQWFVDGSYERVVEHVPVKEAIAKTQMLVLSVGARMGTTKRVIITDCLDCINFEWIYGKGIVYPTRSQCEQGE
jgi:hypothetical protein